MFRRFFILATVIFVVFAHVLPACAEDEKENELFFVAQKAFEDGFYDISINYITQFLQEYPTSNKLVKAKILLGQCYYFKLQYLKAYETFQELLQYEELRDATLFWLGETYSKGADYKQAEKYYTELIEKYPRSTYLPQSYYSLAWAYFEQNNYVPAKNNFTELLKRFPKHPLAEDSLFRLGESEHHLRFFDNAIKNFEDYVVKFPQSDRLAESYFYIAEANYYLEDYLTASTYYAKTAEISKDKKIVLLSKISLGWCYLKLKRSELSLTAFTEAQALSQEQKILGDDIALGLANLYTETGEYPRSIEQYTYLIDNIPDSGRIIEAFLGRANVYYQTQDYPKAIQDYDAVIQKSSSSPELTDLHEKAQFGLAWTYLKSSQFEQAIATFESLMNSAQNDVVKVSALIQIGDAYQDSNNFDKAIETYDTILKNYPESVYTDYAQFRQGVALLKQEKIDTAMLSFQTLQQNFPQSKYLQEIKYYMAVGYFKKDDWKKALENIEEYLKTASEASEFVAESNYILGMSLLNLGQYDRALKVFEDVAVKFPQETAILKNSQLAMAKCLYNLGREADAIKKFNEISIQYPQSDIAQEALLWLGDYYLEKSIFANAMEYYQQYIAQFPNSDRLSVVYYQLGRAHELQEQYDEALSYFAKITNPADKEVYAKAKMAIADIFSKKLDFKTAFETYQNIIATVPDYKRDTYIKMAAVFKDNQEYTKAIEAYNNAMQTDIGLSTYSNAEIQFYLADTYELFNQPEKAVEEYLKIPYLYPQAIEWVTKAHLRIARIFENSERWDEAKAIYKKIIEQNTDEAKFAQERMDWINENLFTQK
ncbi:MAG: hypothetical protein A2Z88_08630 [Omnitrophica WOR_2 bacterium GWA2_47_8]|nr:MAG: hypothetical protein A2Z88_08630 [Omnitrophica WOR_2 bacterium GWA2_47_8]